MKRKITSGAALNAAKLRPGASAVDSSRFCSCPVCGKSVAKALVNVHLDECLAAACSRQGDATSGVHEHDDGISLTQGPGSLPIAPAAGATESSGGLDSVPGAIAQAPQPQKMQQLEQPQTHHTLVTRPPVPSTTEQQRQQQQKPALVAGQGCQGGSLASKLGARSEPKVATAFLSGSQGKSKGKLGLTAAQLFTVACSEVVPNFLPSQLAEEVIRELRRDRPLFTHRTWWFAGIEQKAPQSSYQYWLAPEGEARDKEDDQSSQAGSAGSSGHPPGPPAALQQAASLVAAAVTQRITAGRGADLPLEAADRDGWQPSYCLANCYESGSQGVGWHSDKLLTLGPLPIIASLSLGATRSFQLHREQRLAVGLDRLGGASDSRDGVSSSGGGVEGRGDGSSGGTAAWGRLGGEGRGSSRGNSRLSSAVAGSIERIDTPLPHNTLFIMWPPTQEAWKHRVPKTQTPYPHHPLAGATRYNLTFRRLKPHWEQRAPLCHCGQRAVLRAWQRQSQHNQQQNRQGRQQQQELQQQGQQQAQQEQRQEAQRGQQGQLEPHKPEEQLGREQVLGQQLKGRQRQEGAEQKGRQQREGQQAGGQEGEVARVVRYYYACDNMRGAAPCGFWQRGPEIKL